MAYILVVDDDKDFLEALCEALRMLGHHVVGLARADTALQNLQDNKPDLLITDLIMPVMNGAEFLITLHAINDEFPCPVIAMSGGGRFDTIAVFDSIHDLPINAMLCKPFSLNSLEAHIVKLLQ